MREIKPEKIRYMPDWELQKELAFAEGFAKGREGELGGNEYVWLHNLRAEDKRRKAEGIIVEEGEFAVSLVYEISAVMRFAPGDRDGKLTPEDGIANAIGSLPNDFFTGLEGEGFSVRLVGTESRMISN